MMREDFEIIKNEYVVNNEIKDIWENPVVKCIASYVPFLSSGIDYGLGKAIETRQKKKLETLFEIILEDGTITMDDIKRTANKIFSSNITAVALGNCDDVYDMDTIKSRLSK